jgi:hypothetical protein
MRFFYLILTFLFACVQVPAQQKYAQVFDAITKEPLPFVSVAIKSTNKGIKSDEFGKFSIANLKDDIHLVISYLGYENASVKALNAGQIFLQPKENNLNEVVIRFKNPAHRIIENAIKNKAINDPEQWPYFKYKVYHKSIVTANVDSLNLDKKLGKRLQTSDLYVNEVVGNRQFLFPNLSKETIIASKTSGSKSTLFSSLTPLLQQFGFYRDYITFQGRGIQEMLTLVNPLAQGALKRYEFTLQDTLINATNDSTFVVEFEPKQNANFSGMKGVLYLHSGDFAIEYVEAQPAQTGSLHFKLEQTYERIPGTKRWFPKIVAAEWLLSEFKIAGQKLRFNIYSTFSDIDFQSPVYQTDFDENALIINQDATYQNDDFWQKNRPDSLTFREKNTYDYHKNLSIGKKIRQNIVLNALEWYASGMVPISKKIDLSIQNLLDANVYEGFRPTINVLTNENFSDWLRVDGKLGYGFLDKALKYEGRLRFNIYEKYKAKLSIAYRSDISEPANVQYFIWNSPQIPYELIRTFQLARADSLSQWKAELNFRPIKHTTVSLSVMDEYRNPTYGYQFHNPMLDPRKEMIDRFHTSEIGIGVRFAFGEQYSQIGRGSIITAIPSPTILINLVNGQLHYPEGDMGYTKINAKIEYNIKSPGFGETFLNLTTGKIWGNLPYPYLYNGRGAKSEFQNLIWVANHFNTMGLYEFTSDQYANLFITHSFGQLLLKPKAKWFQPDVSLFQGVAVGSLSQKKYHEVLPLKTLEKGYFESGLMIDNIYQQKLFKLLRIGAGIGIFRRWGANQLQNKNDNWAYRLVWNVKF